MPRTDATWRRSGTRTRRCRRRSREAAPRAVADRTRARHRSGRPTKWDLTWRRGTTARRRLPLEPEMHPLVQNKHDLVSDRRRDRRRRARRAAPARLVDRLPGRLRHAAGAGHRGLLALLHGRRHLGHQRPGGLGLRDHQLRVVDRHRPRRHADLRHPAAAAPEVADERSTASPKR